MPIAYAISPLPITCVLREQERKSAIRLLIARCHVIVICQRLRLICPRCRLPLFRQLLLPRLVAAYAGVSFWQRHAVVSSIHVRSDYFAAYALCGSRYEFIAPHRSLRSIYQSGANIAPMSDISVCAILVARRRDGYGFAIVKRAYFYAQNHALMLVADAGAIGYCFFLQPFCSGAAAQRRRRASKPLPRH